MAAVHGRLPMAMPLEEIHVACKKNYDSSAFPNSRLLNEGERDAGKYRGFYMVSLGLKKTNSFFMQPGLNPAALLVTRAPE